MVKKSILFPKNFLTIGALLLSANLYAADTKKGEDNLLSGLYQQVVKMFEENGVEVRDGIELDDQFKPLDCSGSYAKSLAQIPLFWTWGIKPFSAQDGEILFIKKGGQYQLIEGGDDVRYQPLSTNTKKLAKFTRADLYEKFIENGKHTLVMVTNGSVGIAKKNDKYILLQQGFHHLKRGEKFLGRVDVGDWLKSNIKCEKPGMSCIKTLNFGETGYVLKKANLRDPNEIHLGMKHDGAWVIIKAGLKLYAPHSAPVGDRLVLKKSYKFTTDTTVFADTGYEMTAHFTISIPSENDYKKSAQNDDEPLSYADFLGGVKPQIDALSVEMKRLLKSIIKKEASKYLNQTDLNITDVSGVLEKLLDDVITKRQNAETKSSHLKLNWGFLELADDDLAEHFEALSEEKRLQQLEHLKLPRKKKDRDFKIEQDSANDARLEKAQEYELRKIETEGKYKIEQAQAEYAKYKAKKAQANAEKIRIQAKN